MTGEIFAWTVVGIVLFSIALGQLVTPILTRAIMDSLKK